MTKQTKSKAFRYSIAGILLALFAFWGWSMFASPAQYLIETPTKLVPVSSLYRSKIQQSSAQVYVPVDQQIVTTKRSVVRRYQHQPATTIQQSNTTEGVSAKKYRANLEGQTRSVWSTAEILALKLSSTSYSVENQGVDISEIAAKQVTKQIQPGDQLISLNGKPVTSAKQFNQAEQSLKSADPVRLAVRHGQKTVTETLKPLQRERQYYLGISAADNRVVTSAADFQRIKQSKIVGPSYSLMLFTQMYFDLTDTGKHLPTGTKISGTGQVTDNGRVLPVSGIEQKVYAAGTQGVTDFYVPNYPATDTIRSKIPGYRNNYTVAKETVEKYHLKMTVHPVTSVYDIIGNVDEMGHHQQ